MSESEIIEEWRDITGYEGLYQVSNLGRVRSLDRYVNSGYNTKRFSKGKILSFLLQKNGYAKVMLSKENTVIKSRGLCEKIRKTATFVKTAQRK